MKDDLFYLPIQIGGVELRNPFVVASGPTTKRVDQLQLAERSGWAAASIKQTFNPAPYMNYEPRYRWLKKEKLHTFTAEYRLDMEQGLRLVEEARKKCKEMVIIANYSYVSPDLNGWQEAARRFEAAGAQMLELNLCCPNMSFNVDVSSHESKKGRPSSGASMGQDENSVRLVIEKTREVTNLPLIAKITPEGGRIAEVSKVAYEAGAAAVCSVANRLGIPPIDIWNYKKPIYNLQGQNTMGCLSGPCHRHGRCGLLGRCGRDDDVWSGLNWRLHPNHAFRIPFLREMDEVLEGLYEKNGLPECPGSSRPFASGDKAGL